MTSSHPFIPHYETQDKHKQQKQHEVILMMYYQYGHNGVKTTTALVTLGWNESEAHEALRNALHGL